MSNIFKIIDSNKSISVLFFVVFCMIIIIITHYYTSVRDKLIYVIFETNQNIKFDLWSLSHLLSYMLVGFFIPNFTMTFFTAGILFELFEDIIASNIQTQFVDCKKNNYINTLWCNGFNGNYWYAKSDDVFVNLVGYVIGNSIRTTFFNH